MALADSILVPIDFHQKSEIAIRYGCEIAAFTGTQVDFLHVLEDPYDFSSRAETALREQKQELADKMNGMIRDLHSVDDYRHIPMTGLIRTGQILPQIREVSTERKSTMIAIALGGEPDIKKVMFGSITNNLLLQSTIPVLAISKRIDYRAVQRIVFATDYRDGDIPNLKRLSKLAIDMGVPLELVHIIKDPNRPEAAQEREKAFMAALQKKLKKVHVNVIHHQSSGFVEGITSYIGHDKHCILAITRYRKRFLEWLFANSTVRSVAQMASVPLLMMPAD
ncbi:MAG: universal stress protein [Balneolaceae bacterium]